MQVELQRDLQYMFHDTAWLNFFLPKALEEL